MKCIGAGVLSDGYNAVCLSVKGEFVVADWQKDRVCVFSADGSRLVRSWGSMGTGNGQFN